MSGQDYPPSSRFDGDCPQGITQIFHVSPQIVFGRLLTQFWACGADQEGVSLRIRFRAQSMIDPAAAIAAYLVCDVKFPPRNGASSDDNIALAATHYTIESRLPYVPSDGLILFSRRNRFLSPPQLSVRRSLYLI